MVFRAGGEGERSRGGGPRYFHFEVKLNFVFLKFSTSHESDLRLNVTFYTIR